LPWLGNRSGYEDWCLLDGSWALDPSPGSRALKNAKYEKYYRLRASAQPRISAYREAGWETTDDDAAYSNACRLERRPGVRERIEFLSHQDEELIAEKRRRIEETAVVNARSRYRRLF
jgi:hypothetical protein